MNSDWRVENKRGRISLECGKYGSGIHIDVNKSKRTLSIWGWYDSMVGISGGDISIDELIALFERKKGAA